MEPQSEDLTRYSEASFLHRSISIQIPSEIRDQEAEIEAILRDLLAPAYDPRLESASRRQQTIIGWAFVAALCLVGVFTFCVLYLRVDF